MPTIPWRPITEFVVRAGPIVLRAAEIATGIRIGKHEKEDFSVRIKDLEENLGKQSQLNTELISQMEMLKPALEGIQKSFRLLFILSMGACVLSFLAILLNFLK